MGLLVSRRGAWAWPLATARNWAGVGCTGGGPGLTDFLKSFNALALRPHALLDAIARSPAAPTRPHAGGLAGLR